MTRNAIDLTEVQTLLVNVAKGKGTSFQKVQEVWSLCYRDPLQKRFNDRLGRLLEVMQLHKTASSHHDTHAALAALVEAKAVASLLSDDFGALAADLTTVIRLSGARPSEGQVVSKHYIDRISKAHPNDSQKLSDAPVSRRSHGIQGSSEDQQGISMLTNHCRVCGLDQSEPPWGEDDQTPSWVICPCCGTEFGYEDCTVESARKRRQEWLAGGGRWMNESMMPAGWSFDRQASGIPSAFR